jgi:hypothetical protein
VIAVLPFQQAWRVKIAMTNADGDMSAIREPLEALNQLITGQQSTRPYHCRHPAQPCAAHSRAAHTMSAEDMFYRNPADELPVGQMGKIIKVGDVVAL